MDTNVNDYNNNLTNFININHVCTRVRGGETDHDSDDDDEYASYEEYKNVDVVLRQCVDLRQCINFDQYHTIHIDSQANKGVTSDINLFKNSTLKTDINFQSTVVK